MPCNLGLVHGLLRQQNMKYVHLIIIIIKNKTYQVNQLSIGKIYCYFDWLGLIGNWADIFSIASSKKVVNESQFIIIDCRIGRFWRAGSYESKTLILEAVLLCI